MMEAKGVSFNFATDRDEPDIRRLLRENSMEGQMHISLEREPDAFAADFGLAKAQDFVVARDLATGEAIGICERAVHNCHINGEPRLMPYIGALRVAASHRNKIAIIKGGFAKLRTIVEAAGTSPFALTSIASENKTALRLLAKGLPGLPRYEAAGELSTCVLRASKTQTPTDVIPPNELADAANQWNAQHQFSQVWKASETEQLSAFGLASQSCLGVQASGVLCGSVGLWDQRKHLGPSSSITERVCRSDWPPAFARTWSSDECGGGFAFFLGRWIRDYLRPPHKRCPRSRTPSWHISRRLRLRHGRSMPPAFTR
jgi:hypothetical protein